MPKKSAVKGPPSVYTAGTVEVRLSGIHGKGVYATASIRKGARIIEYTGKHVPWKKAIDEPPRDPSDPYHTFLFSLDNGDVIDAHQDGNEARWSNHSCGPNCETTEEYSRFFVDARRAMHAGEERVSADHVWTSEQRTQNMRGGWRWL